MKLPSSVRVLSACGITASVLSAAGGFMKLPELIGLGGAVMFFGNVYCVWRG